GERGVAGEGGGAALRAVHFVGERFNEIGTRTGDGPQIGNIRVAVRVTPNCISGDDIVGQCNGTGIVIENGAAVPAVIAGKGAMCQGQLPIVEDSAPLGVIYGKGASCEGQYPSIIERPSVESGIAGK